MRQRLDIQGLRALAVVAVILDHLLAWPSGGFVGVDVFFVLSGFLITGLLLREHERTGRISFRGFYRRRARRILPISALVLVVTVGVSFAVYLPARAKSITVDAVWSLLFAGNWHFALAGTDYFATDGTTSPLQHYWSLAVEEQFYVVWPWLLVAVLAIAAAFGASKAGALRTVGIVLAAVAAASLAWALVESVTSPGVAYFSTFARAWELGIGGILAVAAPALGRLPDAVRPVLAWLGLAGIVAAVFTVSGDSGFPAPGGLLPVLATAAVVAAGTGGSQRYLAPITNPVAEYLGDISYSLYLWHFPVVILLGSLIRPGVLYIVICLVATLLLSILSYHFVEDPVRNSTWLDRAARQTRRLHPEARQRRELPRLLRPVPRGDLAVVGVAVVAGLAIATAAAITAPPAPTAAVAYQPAAQGTAGGAARAGTTTTVTGADGGPQTDAEKALSEKVSAALQAESFPDFDPSVDSLGTANWVRAAVATGCSDVNAQTEASCVTGPTTATKTAVVLGDSFAIAWLPGLREALGRAGYRVHTLASGQCPAADVKVTKEGGAPFPDCVTHRDWAISEIQALKPDLVILADSTGTIDRLVHKSDLTTESAAIAKGLATTVKRIGTSAKRVVVLSDPPTGVALQECVTRVAVPADCTRTVSEAWTAIQEDERDALASTEAQYLDTVLWFCATDGRCPSFVGSTPVRADAGHLTVQYSQALAPLLAEALKLEG